MDDNQLRIDEKRYIVSLEMFEGPLDLLLHLINKHKVDIFDIPVAFITQKYLEYLDAMAGLNLNLAAEYLEMAAQLAFLKSRMMVPEDPSDENEDLNIDDGPDPREDLVRQLLEYQKYKRAAEELTLRPMLGRDTFGKGFSGLKERGDQDISSPGLFALMSALQKVFDRTGIKSSDNNEIAVTRVSISARIHQILDTLLEKKRMPFVELFFDQATRGEVVVTFLAVLEMTKLGLTKLHQAAPGTEIHITANADEVDAKQVLADNYMEEE